MTQNNEWEERLKDLKCINGAMYFGSVEIPCSGRETGECCTNEQTFDEALKEIKSFILSEKQKSRDEVFEDLIKVADEQENEGLRRELCRYYKKQEFNLKNK